jgi:prolyl-tRNA editing enzyme YbaK/EbsC (Cys-tRNA(Pro) deacylase)
MKLLVHEASRTSEESSAIRNTPLEWGSKTMLINTQDKEKVLLVYRANRKISWKKLRKLPSVGKKAQMAVEEDVHKLGLKPGGVPPFPSLLGLKGIIDIKFKEVQEMAFNAGHK